MVKQGLSDAKRRQIEEMRARSHQMEQGSRKDTEELSGNGSSFFVRLMLSLLIFAGFLQMHLSNTTFLGVQTEKAIEAVSRDADLRKLDDSVRMKK